MSCLIQHNTISKFNDPRVLTISCIIEHREIDKALLDLGADVNLLLQLKPTIVILLVYQQLALGELKDHHSYHVVGLPVY
jgi:hypothetical protein